VSEAATFFAFSSGEAFNLLVDASGKTTAINISFVRVLMIQFCKSICHSNPAPLEPEENDELLAREALSISSQRTTQIAA